MTTEWVVSAGAERVQLTKSGTDDTPGPSIGEIMFTITNPGPVEDRVVFEIVPGEGADKSWFTVDNQLHTIPAGQSVNCLVTIRVPVGTPAGPFSAQARLYPPDTAPEESSRLYGRFTGDIGPTQRPQSWLWVVLVAAGLIIVVGGVMAWLILRPSGESADPQPSPTKVAVPDSKPSPTKVPVPVLEGRTEAEARELLASGGLKVGTVKHRHQPGAERTVVDQSVTAGSTVEPGSAVDMVITVSLAPTTLLAPNNGANFTKDQDLPTVSWQAVPDAAGYRVQVESEICGFALVDVLPCVFPDKDKQAWPSPYADFHIRTLEDVTNNSYTLAFELKVHKDVPRAGHSGTVRWQVFPLDDFGNAGPPSGYFTFHKVLRVPDEYGPIPR